MRLLNPILLAACLCLAAQAPAQSPPPGLNRKVPIMTRHAEGTFDVKNTPLPADEATGAPSIGRFALLKQFHGDLEGVSKGEMLGAGDPSKGNAGYVAIEHVTGTLHGHSGSFSLQHLGVMDHGKLQLTVLVVPGTGAGDLTGISGAMTITIANGKHSYTFEYTLPQAAQ